MKVSGAERFSQRGFSLVELTIATALFSLGMGSLSLLYLLAVQGTLQSRLQTLAVTQAESLSEMALLAPDARERFIFPVTGGNAECSYPGLCTPDQITDSFMESWQRQLDDVLPNGGGIVCRDSTPFDGSSTNFACDGAGGAVIKVTWEEFDSAGGLPTIHRVINRLPLP